MIVELSDFFNNPSLVSIGPLKIQYYAITWLLSAVFIYLYLRSNEIIIELGINDEKVNDLVFLYGLFIGAMCGGRVGYMLFYSSDQLLSNPLSLFYVWQGGLSFHGGLIGVVISFFIFIYTMNELTWLQFKRLDYIRNLSEQQQVREYRFYLDALSNERLRQNKGETCFLLQENKFYLLQEDGNRIIWCS